MDTEQLNHDQLLLERVEAGWIVTYVDDETSEKRRTVFEDADYGVFATSTNTIELTGLVNMLRWIPEHFGILYSKNNNHNVIIGTEPD